MEIRSTALRCSSVDQVLKRARSRWAATVAHLVAVISVSASLLLCAAAAGTAQPKTFEPRQEEPEEFPDFPGREDTFYFVLPATTSSSWPSKA